MILFLFAAIVAFLVALVIANQLATRPVLAASIILLVYLFETVIVEPVAIPLALLIYPADIVFVLLLLAAGIRYLNGMAHLTRMRWPVIVLIVLYAVALVRGFAAFGVKQAGVEGRESFYFLSGVLYFSSFSLGARTRRSIVTVWMRASMALASLAVLRWMAVLAGLGIVEQWAAVLGAGYRVLNASGANVIAVAFFASMFLNIGSTGPLWQRKAFYLFGPVLLLLQHRTVWAVVLIGFLWLGLQEPKFRKQVIRATAALAVLGVFAVFFLFGSQSSVAVASLQDSASNEDTFVWRLAGWYQLLFANSARNPLNDLIGQPYGTGFERVFMGVRIITAPHSHYVEMFLRGGALGLFFLLLMYIRGMRRMKRLRGRLSRYVYPDSRFWALVLLLQLVYSFTYSLGYVQSILTGVALAGIKEVVRREPSPESSELGA
jgi:hypothetical protein